MTAPSPPPHHEVRVVDGRFSHAECSCGWRGAGRRTRSSARAEARDHALLYADARTAQPVVLPEASTGVVDVAERSAAEA